MSQYKCLSVNRRGVEGGNIYDFDQYNHLLSKKPTLCLQSQRNIIPIFYSYKDAFIHAQCHNLKHDLLITPPLRFPATTLLLTYFAWATLPSSLFPKHKRGPTSDRSHLLWHPPKTPFSQMRVPSFGYSTPLPGRRSLGWSSLTTKCTITVHTSPTSLVLPQSSRFLFSIGLPWRLRW